MSNRKYRIDGRDPTANGYVKEDRMANQQETDALVKVLEGWGLEVAGYKYHLFWRLDDVHGWYLFGISREDGNREDFVILGDCLDALEAPYDKVLDLDDVIQFARTAGSGDNVGTAYDAMQMWGVFNSLSQGFCDALGAHDVCIENERAFLDDKRKEWKLSYDVMFDTDMGGNELVKITIPAQLGNSKDADREFLSEWRGVCNAYCAEERYEDFIDDCEVTADEAMQWAESKERAQNWILRVADVYLQEGRVIAKDEDMDEDEETGKSGEKVWVLTIVNKLGEIAPEVHRTLEGCIEGAIKDIKTSVEVEDGDEDYDYGAIRKELEDQLVWRDNLYTGTVYDIAECGVNA